MKLLRPLILLSCSLIGFSLSAQYGPTSAGSHITVNADLNMSYTIGEVVNIHTVNTGNSNKIGILQPIKKLPSSTTDVLFSGLSLFPNPALDVMTVEMDQKGKYDYNVYDTAGQKVMSGELMYNQVDVTDLTRGSYFIVLQNGAQFYTRQFQKFNFN